MYCSNLLYKCNVLKLISNFSIDYIFIHVAKYRFQCEFFSVQMYFCVHHSPQKPDTVHLYATFLNRLQELSTRYNSNLVSECFVSQKGVNGGTLVDAGQFIDL